MMLRLAVSVVFAVAIVAAVACGSSNKKASPTSTLPAATAGVTSTPAVTSTPQPGEPTEAPGPFQGGRDPVEGSLGFRSGVPPLAELVDVRAASHEGSDRIVFEFTTAPPDYRVEYVPSATACGSGEPVTVAGQAMLQVHFTQAAAHNDQATPTFGSSDLTPGLTSIDEAKQTCDVEGDVTWVIGLPEELDFHVTTLTGPLRLVIDIAHL